MRMFVNPLKVGLVVLGLAGSMTISGCATDGSGGEEASSQSSSTDCGRPTGSRIGRC